MAAIEGLDSIFNNEGWWEWWDWGNAETTIPVFCPTIDCLKKKIHLQVRPLFDVGEKIAAASRRRKRKILGKLATPGKNSVTDFKRAFSRLQFHLLVNEQKVYEFYCALPRIVIVELCMHIFWKVAIYVHGKNVNM